MFQNFSSLVGKTIQSYQRERLGQSIYMNELLFVHRSDDADDVPASNQNQQIFQRDVDWFHVAHW